jgi:hypothetical protein
MESHSHDIVDLTRKYFVDVFYNNPVNNVTVQGIEFNIK